MSLNDEERKILVGLEIEKSRRTFAEIEILRQAGLGTTLPIDCIMLHSMWLVHY